MLPSLWALHVLFPPPDAHLSSAWLISTHPLGLSSDSTWEFFQVPTRLSLFRGDPITSHS